MCVTLGTGTNAGGAGSALLHSRAMAAIRIAVIVALGTAGRTLAGDLPSYNVHTLEVYPAPNGTAGADAAELINAYRLEAEAPADGTPLPPSARASQVSRQQRVHEYPLVVRVHVGVSELLFVDDHASRVGVRMKLVTEWDDPHLLTGRGSAETDPIKEDTGDSSAARNAIRDRGHSRADSDAGESGENVKAVKWSSAARREAVEDLSLKAFVAFDGYHDIEADRDDDGEPEYLEFDPSLFFSDVVDEAGVTVGGAGGNTDSAGGEHDRTGDIFQRNVVYKPLMPGTSTSGKAQASEVQQVRQVRFMVRTLACAESPWNFQWLPVDMQTCTITLRSLVYDRHILLLSWLNEEGDGLPQTVNSANFTLAAIERGSSNEAGECGPHALQAQAPPSLSSLVTSTEAPLTFAGDGANSHCIWLRLVLARNYRFFLATLIVPTACTTAVCWLTLFGRRTPVRAVLLAGAASLHVWLTAAVYGKLARPLQPKILDFWTLSCGGVVLLCVLELFVAMCCCRRGSSLSRRVSGRRCDRLGCRSKGDDPADDDDDENSYDDVCRRLAAAGVYGRKRFSAGDLEAVVGNDGHSVQEDIRPNWAESVFRLVLGLLLGFFVTFYLTLLYVIVNGRGSLFAAGGGGR